MNVWVIKAVWHFEGDKVLGLAESEEQARSMMFNHANKVDITQHVEAILWSTAPNSRRIKRLVMNDDHPGEIRVAEVQDF